MNRIAIALLPLALAACNARTDLKVCPEGLEGPCIEYTSINQSLAIEYSRTPDGGASITVNRDPSVAIIEQQRGIINDTLERLESVGIAMKAGDTVRLIRTSGRVRNVRGRNWGCEGIASE